MAIDPGRIVTIDQMGAVSPALTQEGSLDYPTQVLPGFDGAVLVVNGSFMNGTPSVVALTR